MKRDRERSGEICESERDRERAQFQGCRTCLLKTKTWQAEEQAGERERDRVFILVANRTTGERKRLEQSELEDITDSLFQPSLNYLPKHLHL